MHSERSKRTWVSFEMPSERLLAHKLHNNYLMIRKDVDGSVHRKCKRMLDSGHDI